MMVNIYCNGSMKYLCIINSSYIAHSDPILKGLSLLKIQDMHEL